MPLKKFKAEKQKELALAEAAIKTLKDELSAAYIAVRKAQEEDDDKLPQCDCISVEWMSRKETPAGRMVIMRKTPTGFLITRRFGEVSCDFKFKYENGNYVTAEKRTSSYSTTELRNVPAEFLPNPL